MSTSQAQDERPTISIQLDSDEAIYGVDLQLLSLLSSCARGLPADAASWDLSQLLVEGQPVQRPTVIAYLNSAYKHAYGDPFKEPQPQHDEPEAQRAKRRKQDTGQQPGDPQQQAGQQEVPAQAAAAAPAGVTTFAAMTHLLLFADAVGSTAPLLRACAAGIDKLSLRVQLSTGPPLDLSIRTPYYTGFIGGSNSLTLGMVTEQQSSIAVADLSAAGAPAAKTALLQQVQAQTEALLYAGYKLQLSEVAEVFHELSPWGAMRPVLSPRVMDAAAGYSSLQQMLLLNHLVTRPCTFRFGGMPASASSATLMPVDLTPEQRQPSRFSAEVVQDVLGSTREQGLRLPVEANILENTLKLGFQQYHMYIGTITLGIGPDASLWSHPLT